VQKNQLSLVRFNRQLTESPQYSCVCPTGVPERYLTLHQADQAPTDFAIIADELEAIHDSVARLPSRGELWRVCLIGMLGGSVLTTALGLAFVLH